MESRSPYQQLREMAFFVQGLRPDMDAGRPVQAAFDSLWRQVQAAQRALRDYELSEAEEDTVAQLRILPKAVKSLEAVRASLLDASEYELVGAVDVAQHSAGLDELIARLR